MSELPEPLTPADCDLRGMEWMPLHGHKLYGSDFDAIANDAEYRAAQRLWWASWQQQVPAASLPDDDRVLSHVAGYSRDPKGWARVKKVAMHAFIKCSDGRLYHPFLAPEAIIAWEKRVKDRERKAAYRAKRDGTSDGGNGVVPRDKTWDTTRTDASRDADGPILSHVDRTGQDRTGQFKKERGSLRSPRARDPDPDFEAFWRAYPRKVGKGAAAKAWLKAKTLAAPDAIIAAIARHRFDHRERFIPHPATWLNQERWLDEQSNVDPVLRAAGLDQPDFIDETPDWVRLPGGRA